MLTGNRALGALALAVGGIGAALQLLRNGAGTAAQLVPAAATVNAPIRTTTPAAETRVPTLPDDPELFPLILPTVRADVPAPGAADGPPTMAELRAGASEKEVVARTAWGEARGEGRRGMAAVVHVIRNRADKGYFGGRTARAVALAPFQFSVWNSDDGNRRASLAVTTADPHYRVALELYDSVILLRDDSDVPPQVRSATHYFVTNTPRPSWAQKIAHLGQYQAHSFYREDRA